MKTLAAAFVALVMGYIIMDVAIFGCHHMLAAMEILV